MDKDYLDIAYQEGIERVYKKDGGPFGAVICDKFGNVIAKAHNMVIKTHDPTAHAEITAIRKASEKLNTHDLSDCIIYSSCEPCPMCLSAIIWSNIKKVYYVSTREDAKKIGFKDSDIYDYLNNKNNILKKEQVYHEKCHELLDKYEGELY